MEAIQLCIEFSIKSHSGDTAARSTSAIQNTLPQQNRQQPVVAAYITEGMWFTKQLICWLECSVKIILASIYEFYQFCPMDKRKKYIFVEAFWINWWIAFATAAGRLYSFEIG
jgi:hypothetical protein